MNEKKCNDRDLYLEAQLGEQGYPKVRSEVSEEEPTANLP